MALTVLSVAFPFAPVDDDPVGGAEQVLSRLDRALVAAGHASVVIAAAGSRVAGTLVPLPAMHGEIDDTARRRTYRHVRAATDAVLASRRVDLVHLHGIDFAACLPPPGVPVLVTLHLPLAWYDADALRPRRPRTWLVPVSHSQARGAPAGAVLLPPIANGVDVDAFPRLRKRGFALALGRLCPEKGFDDALDAARAADVPLLLTGEAFAWPEHRRHVERDIRPRLDAARRWIGPVRGARKRRLLAAARCVLVPSRVAETSSLVAMEALAAGTPVIARRIGALPDIVEHDVTGWLVDDVDGMAQAIARSDRIDPQACRLAARRRFDVAGTVADYLALYERLATADAAPQVERVV